ncbi:MAG: cytochrome C oxidase Cbb3 [Acidimicrobiia bacterium]|nr:cytochrome C oxidase Cbb3 [Acidimicrobiia bacterium]
MKPYKLVYLLLTVSCTLPAQDAAALFQKHCAICHRVGDTNRSPLPEALAVLSPKAILESMESGTMKQQAAALTPAERSAIAAHIGKGTAVKLETQSAMCATGTAPRTDSSYWNGWGVDAVNSRYQPAKMAGLKAADLPRLKLKWAFGIPNASAAYAQPTIVGGRIFFGSMDGTVYSADARMGCLYWTFKADGSVRTAITIGAVQAGKYAALFGDAKGSVYAVDVQSGAQVWKTKVEDHAWVRLTGAPKLHENRVYVPVSSNEEVPTSNPKYPCCTFRGSLVALDSDSGKILWKSYTIADEPKPTKVSSAGAQLHGPAGAAVWSSPTIDAEKRLVYIATGNGYSDPSVDTTDAIIAFDMDTGARKWHKQLMAKDNWTFACSGMGNPSCPDERGPDYDIGSSPILRKLSGGKRMLLVGQKSGFAYGIDPDNGGHIVWQTRVGQGSALGGVMWGMAADSSHLYVPVSDVLSKQPGGIWALQIATGEKVWMTPPPEPPCKGTRGCTTAQMAPATALDGIVLSGSMDGTLRAFQVSDGKIVWELPTLGEYETVNGVKAKGGSMNAAGPVIVGGMLYVNSGYGVLGGMAGNVLLAFSIDGN